MIAPGYAFGMVTVTRLGQNHHGQFDGASGEFQSIARLHFA
mgnify:CR=1 FL=1